MGKVKRPLLLTGLILSMFSFFCLLVISIIIYTEESYYIWNDIAFYLSIIILIFSFAIATDVLIKHNALFQTYKKKSFSIKLIIIILSLYFIIELYTLIHGHIVPEFVLLVALTSLASILFIIFGHRNAIKNPNGKVINNLHHPYLDVLKKIEKLNSLKENKTISEEEFIELSQKYVNILKNN